MGKLAQALKSYGVPSISDDGTFVTLPFLPGAMSWLGWGPKTQAGPMVSEESALGLPAVFACIRVLAETVGTLPLILYRRLPKGGKQRAEDHPLYSVLHRQPNPEMSAYTWKETETGHIAGWGDGYSEIVFDALDRMQLWPLPPSRVITGFEKDRKVYDYLQADGTKKRLADGSVFHIPGLGFNGLKGMSVIGLHRETLGAAQATRDFGSAFYRNGARPSIVLSHPKTLSKGAIERLATQMDQMRGSRNAGKTVVMEEGLQLHEIGIPPEDAEYIDTRKLQRTEIASMFRMQPHLIGDLEHATFSNIEHQGIEFVVYTLAPYLVRIEEAATTQLLTEQEQDEYFFEFLVDSLLRGDAQARAQALEIQRRNSIISRDEWRALENRNPFEGVPDDIWQPAGTNYVSMPVNGDEVIVNEAESDQAPALTVIKSAGIRCSKCNRKLAELASAPYRFTCPKCKTVNEESQAEPIKSDPMLGLTEAVIALASREQPIPQVNVTMPDIHNAPPGVTFAEGAIRSPAVNIEPPPPAQVVVNLPKPGSVRKTLTHDKDRVLTSILEEPA